MTDVLRYLGIGNETVFGTPVAATKYIDQAAASLDSPSDTEMYYEGGLSRGVRTRKAGYYGPPQGNVVYATDVDTINDFLRYAMGGYTFTTGLLPPDHEHEHYALEDPEAFPFFTARLGKDEFEHTFVSCVLSQMQIEVADQFVVATMDIVSQQDQKDTLATEVVVLAALPAKTPLTFVTAALEIPAASDISAKVKAFTLLINNNLTADSGRSIGSRFARRHRMGDREITLSADLHFEGTTELEAFWGGASGPVAGGATDFATLLKILDTGTEEIEFDFQSMHHTQVQQQATGRAEIIQSIASKAIIASHTLKDLSTVESEMLVTVKNDYADVSL